MISFSFFNMFISYKVNVNKLKVYLVADGQGPLGPYVSKVRTPGGGVTFPSRGGGDKLSLLEGGVKIWPGGGEGGGGG